MIFLNSLPGAIEQGLIWGIMAIGLFVSFKVLNFADLTVDGSFCTGGAVCAVLIVNGVNVWVALLAAIVAGALAGFITGVFNTVMGIPDVLAGILTQLVLWSVNLKILGGSNLSLSARTYRVLLSTLNVGKSIAAVSAFLVVIIGVSYLFFGTETGSSLRATGANPKMARAQGINTALYKVMGLVISNALVALSGALLAQYQGFADINMGRGAIVTGLAAIIVGLALVSALSENFAVRLIGAVVGSVIYFVIFTAIVCLGLDTDLLKMFSALVVAIFLALPHLKNKLKRRPEFSGKKYLTADGDNEK